MNDRPVLTPATHGVHPHYYDDAKTTICLFQNTVETTVIDLWHHYGLVRPHNDPRDDTANKMSFHSDLFLVAEENG